MNQANAALVREGVENLIANCVGVQKGESILLLNERGRVEPDLVALMEEVISQQEGTPYSLWIDPLARGTNRLPSFLGDTIVASDKLLMNCNLNRVFLLDYLREKGREDLIRINNRNHAADRMATEHARFHWGLVMEICRRIEELTAGKAWHITTPYGTDLSGEVVSGSEVAGAFFVQDAEASRNERVFPGEVYTPVGSAKARGTLAWDHPGIARKDRFDNPIILYIDDNRIADIEWREEVEPPEAQSETAFGSIYSRSHLLKALESQEQKYGDSAKVLDSWHGGMHPKAEKRPGQQSDMKTMHFHLGRSANTLSASVSDQTVLVDGRTLYRDGQLAILDDGEIQAAAREYGVSLP